MKAINTKAIVTSISSHKDGSLGLRMVTPELTSEEKVAVMEIQGKNLEILINPLDDLPEETITVKKDIESKSQGQRIRAVIFLLWSQEGEPGLFEEYYHQTTEKYIEFLKEKLD